MSSNIQPAQNVVLNFQPGATIFYSAFVQAAYNTVVTITDSNGAQLASFSGSGNRFIGQGKFVTSTADIKVTVTGNGVIEKSMSQDILVLNNGTLYLTGYALVTEDAGDNDFNDLTLQLWANSRQG